MKVFISWSGDLSREIGEVLRGWLPDVLQFVTPFFTPEDVQKGKRWGSEIAEHLSASNVGLFCLTAQNLSAPWLIFEAGAISNLQNAHLCPMLFGVDNSQLKGPLAQFQATPYSKEEMLKFISAVNTSAGPLGLAPVKLQTAFDKWWPELDDKINKLLSKPNAEVTPPPRQVSDMVEEVLGIVRSISSTPGQIPHAGHWALMCSLVLERGEATLEAIKNSEQTVALDVVRLELKFLKDSLNLIAPRLVTGTQWKEVHRRATAVLEALGKREIELDDVIPF